MAPSASELGHDISIKEALSAQRNDPDYDCMSCRIMGSVAFSGLGVYTYASGMSQLRQRELAILKSGSMFGMFARRAGIYGISAGLVGLGVYRLVG